MLKRKSQVNSVRTLCELLYSVPNSYISPIGGPDSACSQCEDKTGEEVCGANGKTYNSLCHAVNCGGLKEMDVTFGSCENKDPCAHNHCSSQETCAAMSYGPCLAVYTKTGRKLPCRQYICGKCNTITWLGHLLKCNMHTLPYVAPFKNVSLSPYFLKWQKRTVPILNTQRCVVVMAPPTPPSATCSRARSSWLTPATAALRFVAALFAVEMESPTPPPAMPRHIMSE